MNVIGTCSCCGGEVSAPRIWIGIIPPTPTCSRCGAVAASHGPVIPMVRRDTGGKTYTTNEFPMTQTFNRDFWKGH